ncbi:MAG: DNA translocase FtsK 4TM domain-containing protein [Oxalobacter formigenes]|nr:DNA translocase FtsK 4TM domain-containing protein [Oxalobacter formigenes]
MSKTASVYKRTKEPADPAPAPPGRLARLLTEARWLVLIALTLFFFIVLYTYSPADPGWSHAIHADTIRNMGGKTGAWISDLLLFTFGLSAWWCGLWLLRAVLHGYRRIASLLLLKETPKPGWFRDRLVPNLGFLILLSSSAAIEYLRMYAMKIPLPRAPGGVLGEVLGAAAMEQLGFTGATLILLVLFALGFSLFLQTSWLQLSEKVGTVVEGIAWIFIKAYRIRQDRKIGQEATQKREEILEQEKARVIETPPVQIEPQIVEVPKSDRAEKEKQVVLFSELQELPPLSLLDEAPPKQDAIPVETLEFTSRLIEKKLADFGVSVRVVTAHPGPVVTRYEIDPATGVKGSTIVNLERDLARSLSLVSLRVIETIPGKNYMALELPNPKRQIVRLTEILSSKVYSNESSTLTIALGKDIAGNPVVADLARMPHLLVAGTTGSGKSVAINATILSLLYKADPSQVRMILIDPKMLELSIYEGIPHLLSPVVTDMRQAGHALNWAVGEMERRYKLMSHVGVRNLAGYNNRIAEAKKRDEPITNPFSLTPDNPEPLESLPSIVIIIDELADLMMVVGKKVEELIARIAQKARAAGIHLILATQRPSVDVITGLIKANIPTRIAFQVSSKIDSRTILDQMGAETLLGLGDMLYLPPGTGLPLRAHGAFVSDEEVQRVVNYLREHGQPDYVKGILEGGTSEDAAEAGQGEGNGEADPLYDQAVAVVLKNRRASISLVQRHLRIGYNRAARLLEQMEQSGIVSPMRSNGNREILVPIQPD